MLRKPIINSSLKLEVEPFVQRLRFGMDVHRLCYHSASKAAFRAKKQRLEEIPQAFVSVSIKTRNEPTSSCVGTAAVMPATSEPRHSTMALERSSQPRLSK